MKTIIQMRFNTRGCQCKWEYKYGSKRKEAKERLEQFQAVANEDGNDMVSLDKRNDLTPDLARKHAAEYLQKLQKRRNEERIRQLTPQFNMLITPGST